MEVNSWSNWMIKCETKKNQLRKYKKNSSQLMLTRLTSILEHKIGITHGNKREKNHKIQGLIT